jgi:hypothetical protein
MDVFSTYASDEVAEVEGRWFPVGKDAKVLVARTGNPRYNQAFRKKLQEHEYDLNTGTPEADKLAEEILVQVMAETILLGWEGLKFQGTDVPYTKAQATTLLGVKDFRKRITVIADSLENFRIKAEEAQGNA